jgi:hypothetical protein
MLRCAVLGMYMLVASGAKSLSFNFLSQKTKEWINLQFDSDSDVPFKFEIPFPISDPSIYSCLYFVSPPSQYPIPNPKCFTFYVAYNIVKYRIALKLEAIAIVMSKVIITITITMCHKP